MGRQKRKTNSPLLKDAGKNPRTAEQDSTEGGENEERCSQEDDAVISDLKAFIREENKRNSKSLAEEMRRYNDERVAALENSLSFALATNETIAKRLSEVEERIQSRRGQRRTFSTVPSGWRRSKSSWTKMNRRSCKTG